ncbi:regulator of intracellular pH; Na+/H+ antiporter [Salmonella enterica subsp. arizonae]|uniref:Regulator of intracellular pH Na+/H+ antiporter n=1 Tax=Salmonella enterica subsp. arizonae TaxID=59203 RepID=A0A379TBE3_SALER|nr:regulator of intracellular pH; Na+/H+ antiporter [Salmonella enterica subsp. arizonae]
MEISWGRAMWRNFLGQSPDWYKLALLVFLIINPLTFFTNSFVAGWLLVAEFIFTLAMALKCYPLLPGGLLAIEAVVIGMTSAAHVREEVAANLEVLLLLMFMVAGIYFMKQLLLFIFTRLLLSIRSKMVLSLAFCVAAAFLSAFLDALTVVAVVISVAVGFLRDLPSCGLIARRRERYAGRQSYRSALQNCAGTIPRILAQSDDACGRRYGAGRRHDYGRGAAKPDHR